MTIQTGTFLFYLWAASVGLAYWAGWKRLRFTWLEFDKS
jgi:hypothetical protein